MKESRFCPCFVFLLVLSFFIPSQAQHKVKIGAPKSWIEPVDFNKNASPPAGQESSSYYLLIDEQENVAEQEDFIHYAYKILNNDGLQEMSDINVEFDPSYEQLTVHSIWIHRGDQRINQLPNQIKTLQREQSMERNLYDGSVTAVVNLTDVRVGDIVEYSVTRRGYNPIFDNYISRRMRLNYSTPFEKSFKRLMVPVGVSKTLSFKYVNTENKMETDTKGNMVSYTWRTGKTKGLVADNNEPEWYNPYSYVLITNFKDWAEVATWATKRYQVSDHDRDIIARNVAPQFESKTKEEFALKAIRFVQDEIRYLGFESGLNSHKPHPPADVVKQRFGDCKDKSLLLATLLNAKGIESHPVLLNTYYREKIVEQLPSTNAFDHCIVQVKLNDRIFYVDPTISNQGGSINNYQFPAYGKGLVVSSATKDMIDFPESSGSAIHEVQSFDLASIGGEAMLTVTTTYSGADAESQRSYFSGENITNVQKGYLNFYGNVFPDIQVFDTVKIEDNREDNILVVKEKYKIPTFWKPLVEGQQKIYCELYAQTLETYFSISKSSQRTAPYRLTYPIDYKHEVEVNLPESWTISPEDESIETDFYQYDYSVNYYEGANQLSIVTNYKTLKPDVPVHKFSAFVKDHERMRNNLSYKLSYDPSLLPANVSKWPGIALTVVTLVAAGFLVFYLYRRYDPQPHYPAAWGESIGGWLVLVAIGILLSPLKILYDLATEDYLLTGQAWLVQWSAKNYFIAAFIFLEQIYNVTYLLFSTLVAVLFVQRRSSLPLLAIIFYGAGATVTILDNVVTLSIDPNTVIDKRALVQTIGSAAIWIPYFKMSLRVKKTFVNGYRNDDNKIKEPIAD